MSFIQPRSLPPSTHSETHLYFRVVRCHTKAHQAKGHKLLLKDVHVGLGMVLWGKVQLVE
jgi:hypothetical protein